MKWITPDGEVDLSLQEVATLANRIAETDVIVGQNYPSPFIPVILLDHWE